MRDSIFRLKEPRAVRIIRDYGWEVPAPDAIRIKALDLLRQTRDEKSFDICKTSLQFHKNSDAVMVAVLAGLEAVDDPTVPKVVLADYAKWSPAVKKRAIAVLTSRPSWALALLKAVDAETFPKADLSVDQVRPVVAFKDAEVTKLAEKHWGKIGPATAGEKQARITTLNIMLGKAGPGDAVAGKAAFAKHCAACHTLHNEGGKVGPDLTSADRKNVGYLLAQVVDPSGYIRPEFVTYTVTTVDGRTLTGVVEPGGGEAVTLVNVVDNKPQKIAVPKADIDTMVPSSVSLMPEKLLDSLSDIEIRDLFAYIRADAPKPDAKKLKVCLVSGSLEYKSDESLAGLQKFLEANYPVECVRAFRKTDTDIPGLDALETCDAAIFFTRRLKPEAGQLAAVKKFVESGKPVIGIRTASHGFQEWLEMDRDVFGGDYKNHYKDGPVAEVKLADAAKDHPVLTGVKPFASVGSLYKNAAVAKDVTVLLTGSVPEHTEPVAWVRERKLDGKTQRVFYTSLGHPKDFADANFTRLVANGLLWAAGRDVPK
jgi:putative heme-binding domain-containing protein